MSDNGIFKSIKERDYARKRESGNYAELDNPKHKQTKFYKRRPCVLEQYVIEASLKDPHYDKFNDANGDTPLPFFIAPVEQQHYAIDDALDVQIKLYKTLGTKKNLDVVSAIGNGAADEMLNEILGLGKPLLDNVFPENIVEAIYSRQDSYITFAEKFCAACQKDNYPRRSTEYRQEIMKEFSYPDGSFQLRRFSEIGNLPRCSPTEQCKKDFLKEFSEEKPEQRYFE